MIVIVNRLYGVPEPPGGAEAGRYPCADDLYAGRIHASRIFVEENADYIERIQSAKTLATSQPPIAAYIKTFTELTQAGHQVLCLSISSRLSGTYAREAVCAREIGGQCSLWSIP